MIITLPIPMLLRLKKHRPEIKQLIGLILLGLIHTGLTIARFVIMFYPDPLTRREPQYTHIMSNCLAVVEMDIGIWVATLVVMRPAFHSIYRRLRPDRKREGQTALYYYHSGVGEGGNVYRLKRLTMKRPEKEDELHILETKEIHITSERAEVENTL
jgi:hypothetical protein